MHLFALQMVHAQDQTLAHAIVVIKVQYVLLHFATVLLHLILLFAVVVVFVLRKIHVHATMVSQVLIAV